MQHRRRHSAISSRARRARSPAQPFTDAPRAYRGDQIDDGLNSGRELRLRRRFVGFVLRESDIRDSTQGVHRRWDRHVFDASRERLQVTYAKEPAAADPLRGKATVGDQPVESPIRDGKRGGGGWHVQQQQGNGGPPGLAIFRHEPHTGAVVRKTQGSARQHDGKMRQYGQRVAPTIRAHIDSLAEGYETRGLKPNSTRIKSELERRFPSAAADIPSERTIRYIVSRRARDESEPWSPMTNEPDIDATLALPMLAIVIEGSEGKRRHLTLAEARLVTSVRTAAPTIAPAIALAVSREYISGSTAKSDLDAFLAFAPWADAEGRGRYEVAVDGGWVQPTGAWLRQRQMEGAVAAINARRAAKPDKVRAEGVRVVNLGGDAKRARKSTRKGKAT